MDRTVVAVVSVFEAAVLCEDAAAATAALEGLVSVDKVLMYITRIDYYRINDTHCMRYMI